MKKTKETKESYLIQRMEILKKRASLIKDPGQRREVLDVLNREEKLLEKLTGVQDKIYEECIGDLTSDYLTHDKEFDFKVRKFSRLRWDLVYRSISKEGRITGGGHKIEEKVAKKLIKSGFPMEDIANS